MSQASPLSVPDLWDQVSDAYAEEIVPLFETYADHALGVVGVTPGQRIVDVACGPGTLALLAARRGASVCALDFSAPMIDRLRARFEAERASEGDGLAGAALEAIVGDGQRLPYPDAAFDAGFSMFGLMFFPDRRQGFRELRRVVKPGGRVVVTSWPAADAVPMLATIFGTMRAEIARRAPAPAGAPAAPPPRPPLVEPADYHAEMGAAGFTDITVSQVEGRSEAASCAEMWAGMQRSNAALLAARRQLGDAWHEVSAAILGALESRFGGGPQVMSMPAWMAVARA